MKILLLSLLLFALGTEGGAQVPQEWPEFTFEEFYRALRRVMPEDEANRLARELAPDNRASAAEQGIPSELAPIGPSRVYGVSFISDDVLMLLSIESDDLQRKVERYRVVANGGRPFTKEQQQKWHARYAQFLKWKEAGYPLDAPAQKPDDS